jgi:acetolactate decarboxylase
VGVKLKPGIKPTEIDRLGNLANTKKLTACQLDELHKLEEAFSQKMLASISSEVFIIEEISNFTWNPVLQNNFVKTDILNKDSGTCH